MSSEQGAGALAGRPRARPASDEAGAPSDGFRGRLKRRPAWAQTNLGFVAKWLRDPIAPVIALCAILVISLGLRVY